MAYIGVSPSNGVRRVHTYTATASQTTFSGAGAEGTSLSYKDSNFVDVYQNGIKLGDADYTSTSGTSIVLAQGASVDDLVVVVVFDVFSVADTVSKADGGTFDGNVTMAGTLGVTGAVTADAGISVDNITIDGTEIDLSSGDLTLDVAGDIILDADGQQIFLKNGGTHFGTLLTNATPQHFYIDSAISDGDLIFRGNDGGSTITALTLDMSASGDATFNNNITAENMFIAGNITHAGDNDTLIEFATNTISFDTAGSERFRINSSGLVLFGCTADPSSSVQGFAISPNVPSISPHLSSVGSNNGAMSHFYFINGNGQVGSIVTNGSATAYNTSSDYRLKENVVTDWDATTRLKQLKPSRFNFIADADTTVDGFLAHEVSSIVPEAISGTKDGTRDVGTVKDADGNVLHENVTESAKEDGQTWTKTDTQPVYQQIDQAKLVPLLVKTIQELEARITALESK